MFPIIKTIVSDKGKLRLAFTQIKDKIYIRIEEAILPDKDPIVHVILDDDYRLPKSLSHSYWSDYADFINESLGEINWRGVEQEIYDRHLYELEGMERTLDSDIDYLSQRRNTLKAAINSISELHFRKAFLEATERMQDILTKLGN